MVTGDGDDQLTGDNANNQLQGMRGNDQLVGNGGNDTLEGGRGNDRLAGGAGNDRLDGNSGTDTAIVGGDRAYFSVFETSNTELQIVDQRGVDGSDRLFNIEQFEFADGTYDRTSLLTQFTISGTVFNDINGLTDNTVKSKDSVRRAIAYT